MNPEDEMTTEEAGQRYLLARQSLLSRFGNEDAQREYDDACDVLLATFVDTMDDVTQAAKACNSYRLALICGIKKISKPRCMVVARS